ncbi:MAG: hypothetical protein Q9161_003998 [Pseudevernia consocians]
MALRSLLPLVILLAETVAGVAVPPLKPAPVAIAPRQASTACTITPTAVFPILCSTNLNGDSVTYSVMPPEGSVAATSAPAGPTPTCSMQDQDPSEGIDSAYCVCVQGTTTASAALLTLPTTVIATASCDYSTMPGGAAVVSPTNALGPATTNTAVCQVCTPYAVNGADCTTIPNCQPQAAAATVQAGTSPVHVGTLTGSALYTSVSSALESLCPPVTGTSVQSCSETDQVTIGGIEYVEEDELQRDGEFIVKVATSSYNQTSLRDAMINSAALTAQYSAAGKNCYNMSYVQFDGKKRDLESSFSLVERLGGGDEPITLDMHVCNAGAYAGVQYFDPYWRDQQTPGASDYLDVTYSFQVGPGGQFLCDFIELLTDALAVVEPEFAVEDVELGEELQAICQEAEDAVNSLTGRSTGSWKRDIMPKDQAAELYQKSIPASSEHSLRTRMVSNGMDTLVLDLYSDAPQSNKVAAGAPAGVFTLDAGTSAVYTTVECYGCTAVVLFSGKTVIIQHFIQTPFDSSSSDSTWLNTVINPLESTMLANKAALGENPFVAIFSPWSIPPTSNAAGIFKYKSRLLGDNSIMASINGDFPNLAAQEMIGYRVLAAPDPDFDDTAAGKIVVEWKAPNSPCAYSAGIGTLNLYAESSWYLQVHVNDQGEVVNVGGSSPSVCSLAADDAVDDGNGANS